MRCYVLLTHVAASDAALGTLLHFAVEGQKTSIIQLNCVLIATSSFAVKKMEN